MKELFRRRSVFEEMSLANSYIIYSPMTYETIHLFPQVLKFLVVLANSASSRFTHFTFMEIYFLPSARTEIIVSISCIHSYSLVGIHDAQSKNT